MPAVSMTVNGKAVTGDVEARTLLVQFLRENLRLLDTQVTGPLVWTGSNADHEVVHNLIEGQIVLVFVQRISEDSALGPDWEGLGIHEDCPLRQAGKFDGWGCGICCSWWSEFQAAVRFPGYLVCLQEIEWPQGQHGNDQKVPQEIGERPIGE